MRYEEHDEYYTQASQETTSSLPDADLLEALHAYTSDYYHATTTNHGRHDYKSFDETALLAFGILLEETLTKALGSTGDLAFIEASDADQGPDDHDFWDGKCWRPRVLAHKVVQKQDIEKMSEIGTDCTSRDRDNDRGHDRCHG